VSLICILESVAFLKKDQKRRNPSLFEKHRGRKRHTRVRCFSVDFDQKSNAFHRFCPSFFDKFYMVCQKRKRTFFYKRTKKESKTNKLKMKEYLLSYLFVFTFPTAARTNFLTSLI